MSLVYSSYFGGGGPDEGGFEIPMKNGDFVVVANTSSTSLPKTAVDGSTLGGESDQVLARFTKDGKLKWSRYIGGDSIEAIFGTGEYNDDIILSGFTYSTDFPTTVGGDRGLGGTSDGFLMRINGRSGATVWSTYLGGSADEFQVFAGKTDTGTWFFTGNTTSNDFPVTNGFDNSYGGGTADFLLANGDAFMGTFDPANGNILSASYVGGDGADTAGNAVWDKSGNVYFVVLSKSTDLTASGGAFGSPNADKSNALVVKMDATGKRVWSSVIGGSGDEDRAALYIDSANRVTLVGTTDSINFPATAPGDTSHGGLDDIFLFQFDSAGKRQWAAYAGGNADDSPVLTLIDPRDNAIDILAKIKSTNYSGVGGFDTSNPGGNDHMVLRYLPDGTLDWSTYVSGGGSSESALMRVDKADSSVYVAGSTLDPKFSAVGGFDTSYGGATDGFTVKIDVNGKRSWSTFLGGSGEDHASVNNSQTTGPLIVLVTTKSSNAPTKNAFDPSYNGSDDALLLKLTSSGGLEAASFLGGKSQDIITPPRVMASGNLLLVGTIKSNDFPVTGAADDKTHNGDFDLAITIVNASAPGSGVATATAKVSK
jgi:hypothetical protein